MGLEVFRRRNQAPPWTSELFGTEDRSTDPFEKIRSHTLKVGPEPVGTVILWLVDPREEDAGEFRPGILLRLGARKTGPGLVT